MSTYLLDDNAWVSENTKESGLLGFGTRAQPTNLPNPIMWKRFKRLLGEWQGVLIAAPSVAGVLIILRLAGFLQLLEWAALDQFFRLRPQESVDRRIVIVGISESDIQKVGQWPFPDAAMAQLLIKIKQQQPRAIGLDIYRDLRVEPGHEQLVNVFKTTPNLIGIKLVSRDGKGLAINPPPALRDRGQIAASNLILDPDGKVRRGLLFLETSDGLVVPTLGLTLALMYLEGEGISPENSKVNPEYLQLGKAVFVRLRENDGGYAKTSAQGYQILMNFRKTNRSFPIVSMRDVLENRIPPDLMRDRIVLIGSTARSLQDYFNTPYDSSLIAAPSGTSGVEIHANLTSQIISAVLNDRPLIKVWSEDLECLWIFGWAAMGVGVVCSGQYIAKKWGFSFIYWTPLSISGAVFLTIASSYVAFLGGWWIPAVPSVLALIVSAGIVTIYILHVESKERQILMKLFERRVTSKLAEAIWRDRDKLLEDGQLPGQEMTATVLFTDLKGFSSIAEGMEPKILMSWLNEYMDAMAKVVLQYDGAIDKFIGDAIMAVFGIPIAATTQEAIAADAQKAVFCALAMARALKSLNQRWQSQGKPTVSMRVGIATGTVVAGSLGCDLRQDYTILGDTVNIAARLESYDKSIEGGICRILISDETCSYCQDKFFAKFIGSVLLKGREQPVKVYQIRAE